MKRSINNNKNKRYRIYPIEILYLIIISAVVFFMPVLLDSISESFSGPSVKMKKILQVNIDENTPSKEGFLIKDKLMVQSGENLICFNAAGEKEWSRPLKSEKTRIIKWNDFYLISDLNAGMIACVDSDNKVIAERSLKRKINQIVVSKDNIYVLMDDDKEVLILGKDLKETRKIKSKHGDVIKIACDFESSELILYTTSMENNEFKSFCIVYDNKGSIIASMDLNGALMFEIYVDDNIVMVSDERLYVFNRIVRPIAEFAYTSDISDSSYHNGKLYLISAASEGNAGEKELKVYDSSLNQVNVVKLAETANKVVAGSKYIISASDMRISIMDMDLNILQEINLNDEVKEIQWISDDSFFIVGEEKLIIYSND